MLTTETLNSVGFKKILIRYQNSLQSLRDSGITIPDESRLFCYERSIERLADKEVGVDPEDICDLMFDLIEADEMIDIILNEKNILSDEVSNKLTEMIKGLKVKNIVEEPLARSSQFELYIRTLLNLSGLDCKFNPTQETQTPDLIVKFDDKDFYVEVKRPLSSKNIHRNTIKGACSQLNAQNPGMIILSLDHILLGVNKVISLEDGDSIEDGLKLLESETSNWLDSNKKKLKKRFKKEKSVCALLLIVKAPVFIGRLDRMSFANHLRLVSLQDFSKDNSKYVKSISDHFDMVWGKN